MDDDPACPIQSEIVPLTMIGQLLNQSRAFASRNLPRLAGRTRSYDPYRQPNLLCGATGEAV